MRLVSIAAAGVAAAFLIMGTPASAQVELGLMLGEMQSRHNEAICQANRRPDPAQSRGITSQLDVLVRQLHNPALTPKQLAQLFSKMKGAKVANLTQLISQEDLRTELNKGPRGAWKHLVVGADHRAARGVWRITIPGVDGGPETIREFGFDFGIESGRWKVIRAQEYPGPLFAPEPDPFCHLATTSSY